MRLASPLGTLYTLSHTVLVVVVLFSWRIYGNVQTTNVRAHNWISFKTIIPFCGFRKNKRVLANNEVDIHR